MQADAGEDLFERAVRITRDCDYFATPDPDIVSVADPPPKCGSSGQWILTEYVRVFRKFLMGATPRWLTIPDLGALTDYGTNVREDIYTNREIRSLSNMYGRSHAVSGMLWCLQDCAIALFSWRLCTHVGGGISLTARTKRWQLSFLLRPCTDASLSFLM